MQLHLLAWMLLHDTLLLYFDSWFTVVPRCISATQSLVLCVGATENTNHREHQVLYVKDSEECRGSFSLH